MMGTFAELGNSRSTAREVVRARARQLYALHKEVQRGMAEQVRLTPHGGGAQTLHNYACQLEYALPRAMRTSPVSYLMALLVRAQRAVNRRYAESAARAQSGDPTSTEQRCSALQEMGRLDDEYAEAFAAAEPVLDARFASWWAEARESDRAAGLGALSGADA